MSPAATPDHHTNTVQGGAHYSHTLNIAQLKSQMVSVLALRGDHLVASSRRLQQLFVYDVNSLQYVSTAQVPGGGRLWDAALTAQGRTVHVTRDSGDNASVTTDAGKPAKHDISAPWFLSEADDDVICFADFNAGIYRSANDGASWEHVLRSHDGWNSYRVVKVTSTSSTDDDGQGQEAKTTTDDYWTLQVSYGAAVRYRLRVYSVHRDGERSHVTAKDVPLPGGVVLDLQSALAYDGHSRILLADGGSHNNVLVLSASSGQYEGHLLPDGQLDHRPYSLAVDKSRGRLYVGQWNGTVKVFSLNNN